MRTLRQSVVHLDTPQREQGRNLAVRINAGIECCDAELAG